MRSLLLSKSRQQSGLFLMSYDICWKEEFKGRKQGCAVNREGVDLQQVKILPGNWVAPAGSYRSGGGGNETVGAFETDGSLGDSASRQAVTASECQAGLETTNVCADPALGRGRP